MIFSLLAEGTLIEFLSSWQIIVAIILMAVGIATALTTKWAEKHNAAKSNKTWRTIALIIILVGLVFFIVGAALLGGIF